MRLLLIDANVDFCRVLESVLSSGGIRVDSSQSPGNAWRTFAETPTSLIVLDLPADTKEATVFLSKVREHPSGTSLPIILMSEVHHKSSKEVERLMRQHRLQEFLPRPFEMFGVAKRFKQVAEAGGPKSDAPRSRPRSQQNRARQGTPAPSSTSPVNRETFRRVVQAWLNQETGFFRQTGRSDWTSIYSGGLSNDSDAAKLKELLEQEDVQFQAIQQDGVGSSERLARLLWDLAEESVPVSFEIQLEKRRIQHSRYFHLAAELPLSAMTQKILSTTSDDMSTGETLRQLNIRPQDVARQLGALRTLGLLSLLPVEARIRPQRPAKGKMASAHPTRPQGAAGAPKAPTPQQTLRRLLSETKRLEGQDPYTILGIAPKSTNEMLKATVQRMESRYSKLSRDPDLSEEARTLAANLAQVVVEAEAEALQERSQAQADAAPPAPKRPQADPESIEELAFAEGTKAFAAGDFARATQCFRKARNERIDSVRNLAWLGWAIFYNGEMSEEQRHEESVDMLKLAVSFDPRNRQAQFFLAYVESKLQEPEKAIERLQNLLVLYPDHKEAKRLLHILTSKKS